MIVFGKVKPGSTLEIEFDTFDGGTGASITLTGLATTDIEVFKDGGNTARASDTGYALLGTDGIDEFGVGIHGISIDLSSNATANFYEAGSRYTVVIDAVTVDTETVRFIAAKFLIGYEGAILDTTITSLTSQIQFILEEGPAEADALNGCPVLVHDLASAVQIAQGLVSDYIVTTREVFLAVDPGIFTMAAGDNVSFFPSVAVVWDEVITGGNHDVVDSSGRRLRNLQEFGVYDGGAVWIDTVNGSAGTTDFESGTAFNQVNSIGDANTLASSLGLNSFRIAPNSSITFVASQANQIFHGDGWTLALGAQSIAGSSFIGADISGTGTGVPHEFHDCHIAVATFAGGQFVGCGLEDTFTISAAAEYTFINCFHNEMGAPSTIDFGAAVGVSEVHIHNWHGNLLVRNMDTGDILHFSSSNGTLELDSSNTAGTANLSGTFGFTDNSSGMTINDNGQALNVMTVNTVTLPGQVAPPLTPTMEQILAHLYKNYRNRKEQTATDWSLFADDESTVDQAATVSDSAGVARKTEIIAGV